MTIQEVINTILNYHPYLENYQGCDEFKCGDPSLECTGVVAAMLEKRNKDGSPREYSVQIIKIMEEFADLVLPGEVIDWTLLSYIRDAVQLGKDKAMLTLGHYNWEELGMRYMTECIRELVGEQLPVTYVPSEDMYQFFL